jgi:hypothetical protein
MMRPARSRDGAGRRGPVGGFLVDLREHTNSFLCAEVSLLVNPNPEKVNPTLSDLVGALEPGHRHLFPPTPISKTDVGPSTNDPSSLQVRLGNRTH